MALCRKRKKEEEDVVVAEIKSMTAWSESQLMWPLVKYHMCNVLDDADTVWNAGRYAPASIRIRLTEGPQHVVSVKLQAEMSPIKAAVHHEIRAGSDLDSMRVVGCIRCVACHGEWLGVNVNEPNVQYIEVKTMVSPSYVAWRRIKVFGLKNAQKI